MLARPVQGRPINCEMAILVNVLKDANLWSGTLTNYSRLAEGEEKSRQRIDSNSEALV